MSYHSRSGSDLAKAMEGAGEDDPLADKRMESLCVTSASLNYDRTRVPLHGVLGTTADGVTAYSNKSDSHWTNTKHYEDNLFMGYKWQCVEFARRWLWKVKGLYLPSRSCAYRFAGLEHVYRPTPGRHGAWEEARESEVPSPTTSTGTGVERISVSDYSEVTWVKSPCTYHRQGSRTAPVAGSLIIYPMSCGSPWGHIGVIVDVDLVRRVVYVADQNRFFGSWGNLGYSAAYRLDVKDGRHYIRDPESECKGWLVC